MKRLLAAAAIAATASVLFATAPASALPCQLAVQDVVGSAVHCLPSTTCPTHECFPPPGK